MGARRIWQHRDMDVEVLRTERLRYDDGSPVRAASAVVPLGDGHLVVSDDATFAAWFRPGRPVARVGILPPVEGHEVFDEESGTKELKPDLEAACAVEVDGTPAVLLLGSGSSPRRMRWCLLRPDDADGVGVEVVDMAEAYARVASALGVAPDVLNLEGACVVGGALRWFHRGLPAAGLPSGSVDLGLHEAVGAVRGEVGAAELRVTRPVHYDLGTADGVALAITDVVHLPDGTLVASAAAEDSPNARDDGPVTATALASIRDDRVVEVVRLPDLRGSVLKVEGLMLHEVGARSATLLAVTDVDDAQEASWAAVLRVRP